MSETELELYTIVGKMFREMREKHGYSLETVALHLGIAPKSIQRYECGERKIKIGTIKTLCEFYGIDYYSFIKEAKSRFTGEEPVEESYYLNEEAKELAEFMFKNPEYKVLFDASRKVKKEDIAFVKQMIDRMRGDSDDTGC